MNELLMDFYQVESMKHIQSHHFYPPADLILSWTEHSVPTVDMSEYAEQIVVYDLS